MRKLQPYQQYEVLAIENWLNEIAEQGYELTEFGANICKFRENPGQRVYYRVRYIDGNKEIGDTFWWGDLYIYHSTDPNDLPAPQHENDSKAAAKAHTLPGSMFLNATIVLFMLFDLAKGLVLGDTMLAVASALCMLCWVLDLVSDYLAWSRARSIASGKVSILNRPPEKLIKPLSLIAMIPGVIALMIVFLVNA